MRKAYRDTAMLVTGSDQMKQEQVTVEMEQFEDDLRRLLEVHLVCLIMNLCSLGIEQSKNLFIFLSFTTVFSLPNVVIIVHNLGDTSKS